MIPDLAGVRWRKSTYSNGTGGACVEAAVLPQGKAVRDSKNPNGGALIFTDTAWTNLLTAIKDGDLRL